MAKRTQLTQEQPKPDSSSNDLIVGERRGKSVYRANPSLPLFKRAAQRDKITPIQSNDGSKQMLIADGTGELIAEGTVAFVEKELVDTERFVKVYLDGLDSMFKLSKTGQSVFKLLWLQVQENPDVDKVALNQYIAEDYGFTIAQRTMNRGINELLNKTFLYNSMSPGMYFYNVQFMFNGNRIVTAKQYVLEGTEDIPVQQTLPLEPPQTDDPLEE